MTDAPFPTLTGTVTPAMFGYYGTRSSDSEVFRSKDGLTQAARDVSRTSDYGGSVRRTLVDNMVGANLKLVVSIDAKALGIDDDTAGLLSDVIEQEWNVHAEGPTFGADAQRKQTFSGLMRTAASSYVTAGEALSSVEWKPSLSGYATCLNLIDPERLSDPNGAIDPVSGRRMGVWRDYFGEPVAYSIRRFQVSDSLWTTQSYVWDVFRRYTDWGRPVILHAFEHDRPEMTRGISAMTTEIDPLRNIRNFLQTEMDASSVRAQFAAVIRAEVNYDQAMQILGNEAREHIKQKGFHEYNLHMQKDRAQFYNGQELELGKAKIVHLLPNEKMELLHSTQAVGSLKEFVDTQLYSIASGTGTSYSSLTKNYSQVNYSGGRMEMAEVDRGYSVRRDDFFTQLPIPFFFAWLEEAVVVRGTITIPGKLPYYQAVKYISVAFEVRGKTRLDPLKEIQADIEAYKIGANSLKNICDQFNLDWREIVQQRALEKKLFDSLGLKPEDINWELLGQGLNADPKASAESK